MKSLFMGSTLTGQFELTPHCNLNCKTCYIHEPTEAGRKTLPASFWIEKAQQAVSEGMLVLSLTGGETLLYPELDELMDALSRMGLLISFNTNGTLVDEKRVDWFLKYCPNKINVSLYGASNDTYQKMCGLKDGFARTARAIDLLMAAGLNVYLNGMITPENIHELSAMHRFATQRGLILHLSAYAFPLRSQPGQHTRDSYRFAAEDAARAEVFNKVVLYGRQNYARMGARSLMEIDLRRQGSLRDRCTECNGGKCNFQISCDGNLHPCAMLPDLSVSLEQHSFSGAWKLISEQMKNVPFPDRCNGCERKNICPVCKGAVYLETGSQTEAPEYLCRYSEALETMLRRECSGVSDELQNSGDLNFRHCTD